MSYRVRGIWMDNNMRSALKEYAWSRRLTVSAVIRAVIQDVADHPLNEGVMVRDATLNEIRASIKVDDEVWARAKEAAHQSRQSVNSLIRRRLRKILVEEGLL